MKNKDLNWKKGNRAFYWTAEKDTPLCLQSKEYNRDRKGVTWVYYSRSDAYRLYTFLEKIFKKD